MPCGPDCACDPGIECLAVVDPERFGFFRDWCASGDATKREHVRRRSAIGVAKAEPEPAPATPPGLLTRAATFTKAIVTHAIAGLPNVSEETFEARMATCRACPDMDQVRTVCTRCTCGLNVKARWAGERCPVGKWEASPA